MKKVFKMLLIILCVAIALGLILFLYARFVEPTMLRITPVKIEGTGKNLKIALFSDTHFGRDYDEKNIERIVEKINGQNPDIVVFSGDFMDNYQQDKAHLDTAYLSQQLANIRGEKFAVFGNHDYGGGAQFIYPEIMSDGGFTLLTDEAQWVESLGVTVFGYDDLFFRTLDPALYTPDTEGFTVFVSHEPDMANHIQSQSQGVILSGHSHGGQIRLPLITEKIMPAGAKTFWDGFYSAKKVGGSLPLYVSSGIGTTLMPLRFGNIPEVVILEISA